jgi:O-antigen/teichoic acid export membrane protein
VTTTRVPERVRRPPVSVERRAAARGVAWGGVESLTSALVGLVLTPLVVRTCGLEGLGLWAASWSLAHTTNLLDLGVGSSYTRFTSQAIALSDVGRLNRTLAAGTGFHLAIGVVVACAALLLGPTALGIVVPAGPLAPHAGTVFGCTLGTVLLRTTLSAYRGVVAGAQRIDALGRIGAAASLVEGMGAAGALVSGWSLSGMAINSLLVATGASLAEARLAHRLVPGLRVVPFLSGREEWRELLSFGLKLQVVRASEILAAHAPRLALAAGAGLAPAGLYDLGARVAGVLQVSALPLPVIQPLAGRLSARGETERLRRLVERATRYVALLAIPCASLVLLDAGAILKAWTGQNVPPVAASTARLLALALLCGFIASPLRLVLRGCGRPGPEALAALTGALLTVGLAIVLAPIRGAEGVAAAVLCGALLAAGILAIGARGAIPGLAGTALRNVSAPLLAASAGLVAAALMRSLLGDQDIGAATRLEVLLRLLPEGVLLCGVTLLVALLAGALLRQDVQDLAVALVPGRLRAEGDPAEVLGTRGPT